jgi:hypothetical protein
MKNILDQPTKRKVMEAITAIKFDLSIIYRHMLDRISARGLKLLHWVFHAGRVMTVQELRFAVGIELDMSDLDCDLDLPPLQSFLDSALGLLTTELRLWDGQQLVRFSHLTIRDYLSNHASEYFLDRHILLTRTCLTYLNFTALSSESGRTRFMKGGDLYPFFDYASREWGTHAYEAENDTHTYDSGLEWLLSERFWQVLQVYSKNSQEDWFSSQYSPLHEACNYGMQTIVVKLLELGLNANALGLNKLTPLHFASLQARSEAVQALLQCPDIKVNVQDAWGMTPLHRAIRNGSVNHVYILHPGFQVNLRSEREKDTPIHWAVKCDYIDIVHQLLHHPDIQPDITDRNGDTPLLLAARYACTETVRALLSCPNVNVNHCNANGQTALVIASDAGHIKIVHLLLSHKDIDSKGKIGE